MSKTLTEDFLLSMNRIYWVKDPENWIIIADVHLTKDFTPAEDEELIEQLEEYSDYKVLVNGDFLNHHVSFKDAFIYHSLLMRELASHPEVVFLNGNNDPDISQYDEAVFLDKNFTMWTIKHGHSLPKFLCRLLNLFKMNKTRPARECPIAPRTKLYDKWSRKWGLSCTMIAHYHFECRCIYDFLVMAPRKVYKLI